MRFSATIYRLKQDYGFKAELVTVTDLVVDPSTGDQEPNEIVQDIGTVVLMPSRVVASSFAVFRTRNHPGGAFYTKFETIALIDRNELVAELLVVNGDTLRIPSRQEEYKVAEYLDLIGEEFIELGLEKI